MEPVTVLGVKYTEMNYDNPSSVSFQSGGIGEAFVVVKITSQLQEEINGSITFCYEKRQWDLTDDPTNVEHFFETNVNIDNLN